MNKGERIRVVQVSLLMFRGRNGNRLLKAQCGQKLMWHRASGRYIKREKKRNWDEGAKNYI